jgi:hypothetical protein
LAEQLTPDPPEPVAEPAKKAAAKKTAKKAAAKKQAARKRGESPAAPVVLTLVRDADGPVNAGTAARFAREADPSLDGSRWAGAGQFGQWVQANLPEIGYSSQAPGWLWDPARFGVQDLPLQRQVQQLTETPPLSKEQYATLLTAIAEDVGAHEFQRAETSKRVRDACQRAGLPVGRASVATVIERLLYAGFKLRAPLTPREVAKAWADHVISLCRGARMELSDSAIKEIRDWVGGGLAA